jgi:ParB/RepB/Spo0J family partition protein
MVRVAKCHESKTNPRGTSGSVAEFHDLVASIREKGVLVIVRVDGEVFEVIAGSRRLRAAQEIGLK